jgi:osmotically-inducible protein OsmY
MKRLLIAFVAVAALGAACNQKDADSLQNDAGKLAQSATEAMSNATLAGKVKFVLEWRKDINLDGVKTETQDGKVTLNGTVVSEKEHATILDLVKGIKGVDKVVDNLVVH